MKSTARRSRAERGVPLDPGIDHRDADAAAGQAGQALEPRPHLVAPVATVVTAVMR